jgi:hypothetical protein
VLFFFVGYSYDSSRKQWDGNTEKDFEIENKLSNLVVTGTIVSLQGQLPVKGNTIEDNNTKPFHLSGMSLTNNIRSKTQIRMT